MLKWLKQKPLDGLGAYGPHSEEIENITDDPLATIQVQPKSNSINRNKVTKTNTNGNNEIYAVSRVNPLYKEEDSNNGNGGPVGNSKGGLSPNHSGSSGYDSGPSDDDSLNKKLQYDYVNVNPDEKNFRLFSGQEDVIIHHEATVVTSGSNYSTCINSSSGPFLQVLEQNPNFVKNITVCLNRPLTPIDESFLDGQTRKLVSSIQVPIRNVTSMTKTKPGDSVGVAKILQRNKNYVQSIRIGPDPSQLEGQFQRRNKNFGDQHSIAGRKPSVTFSEKVDFVDGKASNSRRTSSEHDSIVSESLLMMTSNHSRQNHNNDLLLQEVRARRNRMKSEIELHNNNVRNSTRLDLTDFSNSLSKNRIVKQIGSNGLHPDSGKGGAGGGAGEMIENNGSDEEDEDHDHYSGERSDSSSSAASAKSQTPSSRRGRSISSTLSTNKSAFGGIADHYAAAKEIAKEIESYSTAANGKSMGISLVRDLLLSNRGRSHSSSTSSSFSFKQNKDQREGTGNRFGAGTLVSTVVQVQQPRYGETSTSGFQNSHSVNGNGTPANKPWVHPQVYVKENFVTRTTTTTDHSFDGEDEGQDQIPIYEVLPGAARLRHEDSDSGNSTDRSPKDSRRELGDSSGSEAHFDIQTTEPPSSETNLNQNTSKSNTSGLSRASSSGSNSDKVMIVTGDSQNMVVDLSAVPLDLREAIISGTALMTFPDGLRQLVDPGYTMITIPSDGDHSQHLHNKDEFGTKNKAQFWDTLQNGISPNDKSYSGKDKKYLTGLPFHPNHDSHTTPDFTMDGHRLAIQTRKVKNGKKRRCFCRICGMVFFLVAFLGVIVTLSLIYTNGRHYFGSA